MLAFKKFQLLPDGDKIDGGSLQYNADTDTGIITYAYDISGHLFHVVPLHFSGSGNYKVDPKLLVSANHKVGDSFQLGPISMTIKSIVGGKAVCDASMNSGDVVQTGQVVFDVSGQFIQLLQLNVGGTVKGFSVHETVVPS
jgi:hypothetical protein